MGSRGFALSFINGIGGVISIGDGLSLDFLGGLGLAGDAGGRGSKLLKVVRKPASACASFPGVGSFRRRRCDILRRLIAPTGSVSARANCFFLSVCSIVGTRGSWIPLRAFRISERAVSENWWESAFPIRSIRGNRLMSGSARMATVLGLMSNAVMRVSS